MLELLNMLYKINGCKIVVGFVIHNQLKRTSMTKQYDGLTERDIENLNFLVNTSDVVLRDWMLNYADQDDLDYAGELLEMLRHRLLDLAAERSDLSESREIISKFVSK